MSSTPHDTGRHEETRREDTRREDTRREETRREETRPGREVASFPPEVGPGTGFGDFHQPDASSLDRMRSVLVVLALSAGAVVLTAALGYGHYVLLQAPHRLLKVLLGLVLVAVFLVRPGWSLYLLPFSFPFVMWLPKSGVPMLNGMNLLVFSLVVGWVGRTLSTRRPFFERTPWDLPLSLFLAWVAFGWLRALVLDSAGTGMVLASTQSFWAAIVGLLLYFVVFNNVRGWKQVRLLALIACIGNALGLLGLLWESRGLGGDHRVSGGFGQENVAGAFYAAGTLFTLGLLTGGYRGFKARALLFGSFAASCVAMVLPASRGAFVGFLAGALPQVFRGGIIWMLVLILVVTAFFLWAPDYVKERVLKTQEAVSADSGDRYDALNEDAGGRLEFWKASLTVIKQNPVLGVGFQRISSALRPLLGAARPPHNLYLEVAAELGIPGLLLLLWLFGSAWWWAGDLLFAGGFPRALGLAYRSALAALVVSNIFGGRFFDFSLAGSFTLLTALVFRARALLIEEQRAALESEAAAEGPAREPLPEALAP